MEVMQNKARAWIEVDLNKIAHNVNEIKKIIPASSKIMGIVKANAYGHGDIACTKELIKLGVNFFGVANLDEAIHLRKHGVKEYILILGYTPISQLFKVVEYDLIQTIVSLDYALKLQAFAEANGVVLKSHLKVDTGMSRLGIVAQPYAYHIDEIKTVYGLRNIDVQGIFSHFAVSDLGSEEDQSYTKMQIEYYERVLSDLKASGIKYGLTHLQNSYGVLNYPGLKYDFVRIGLLYLGVTSNDQISTLSKCEFQPIMQLRANISLVKIIDKGVSVSYGRYFIASKPTKVASVCIGYGDGLSRSLTCRKLICLVKGIRCEVIGNICMDQCMVDVSSVEDVQAGDVVTFFGWDRNTFLSIDEMSRTADTINNDTLCWFNARLPRIYK